MKRYRLPIVIGVVLLLVIAGVVSLAARGRKVEVQTGEQIVCAYGHDVSDSIRTIEVDADKAWQYSVSTKTITCPDHLKAEQLYSAAQDDIAKADLKAAEKKLAQVVALDPAFKSAQAQLDVIKSGKTPEADSSAGDSASNGDNDSDSDSKPSEKPSTPGDDAPATGPVAALSGWMPDPLAGFTADKSIADVFTISREYVAKSRTLVIAAEQLIDKKASAAALSSKVKLPYASDGKSVKVNGHTGFIGTNGDDVAVLGITDGPVLVIFQMRSADAKPTSMYDDLLGIAEDLPR